VVRFFHGSTPRFLLVLAICVYLSENCYVYDLFFELEYDNKVESLQSIAGTDFAGGLVGENRGSIEKSRIDYNVEHKTAIDSVEMGRIMGKTGLFIGESNYNKITKYSVKISFMHIPHAYARSGGTASPICSYLSCISL